ncbi:MAG: hypothetical protein NT004_16975 [Bacteroidetes bacterium]|nr:hypothetical protein [Bacteroidota bacterium]
MRTGKLVLLLFVTFAFHSCFKEDVMIPFHPRGDVQTDTIAMTETYKYQLYFSLDSGSVVSSNIKTASDLGFESTPLGWRVILNSSSFMKAADLGAVEFGVSHDMPGVNLCFDKSDGNPDSTAIGEWFTVSAGDTISTNHVYAVNRGMDELGNQLGEYQVIFDSLKAGTYYFRYALLSGGIVQKGVVHKDPMVNYLWFSFKENVTKPLEPPNSRYDLLFTQYTTMLYDKGAPYPYLVTGVLSNRMGVAVARDTIHPFSEIIRDVALTLQYSKALDAIGYDWKDPDKNYNYTIHPNLSYIIRNQSGNYYKLRFIGFYDRNGSKGYPVIEYQQL